VPYRIDACYDVGVLLTLDVSIRCRRPTQHPECSMPFRDFRPLPVLVLSVGFSFLPPALKGQEDIPDGSELTISPADRILTLATFWSEAKYNFAFWDRLPDLNWPARSELGRNVRRVLCASIERRVRH
jgi:hypothetical protein